MPVSLSQFEMRQPDFERDPLTDRYYFDLTNRLIDIVNRKQLLAEWPSQVVGRAMLGITGYFQDIIADGGIWRSFTDQCRELYSKPLPFYAIDSDYIDYELNPEDVRFVLWYSLALNYKEKRISDPLAEDIAEAAHIIWEELDRIYDEAPLPQCWTVARQLELNNPEEARQIYSYGNWLFMYCYLMSPAYSYTLLEIMESSDVDMKDPTAIEARIEQSMMEDPTGALALYLKEWMYLTIEGRLPKEPEKEESEQTNPVWDKFLNATGGERIAFFGSYGELNTFFIDKLGWAAGEEHLPQLREEKDFVLLADPHKGILLAKNVARCIKYPGNPYYDKEYAESHAIELLTERGVCPADLLHFLHSNKALPDARFKGSKDTSTVEENFDFIARCYLQLYYRGD